MVNILIKRKSSFLIKRPLSLPAISLPAISLLTIYIMILSAVIIATEKPIFAQSDDVKLIDRIVAVVNNDIITLVELNTAMQPYLVKLETSDYGLDKKKEIRYQLTRDMINRMVERKITDQEARRLRITVSDKEVDAAIEKLKESQLMSQQELEKALLEDGIPFPVYKDMIRDEILRPKLINQSVKSKVVITDSDIKEYYEKNIKNFSGKKKYYLRNILLKADELTSKADKESQKNRADQIKQRLDAGEDFKTVAAAESDAPNASEGGDLGFFDWDILSDSIKNSISNLNAGQHTGVIATDQGYQIFYIEKIDSQEVAPLNEVSENVSKKLYDDIVEKKFREWMDALKEKSHIKIML